MPQYPAMQSVKIETLIFDGRYTNTNPLLIPNSDKMKKLALGLSILLTASLLIFSACEKETVEEILDLAYELGWIGGDDMDTVPTSTNLGFGNTTDLPSSVDLVPKFPPIGDQGAYGTCVAWAVAYNTKTAINGIENGLSSSQLNSPAYQFSPKDLFTAIPDNLKGNNCNGTNFVSALDIIQNRGVATVQTVPYNSLGSCSQNTSQSSWANEASNHKIAYWRKIEATVTSIKQNLANNVPVVMGAKLADNFMSWNTNNVLSSNSTYNNVGQHAYHALVIAGYDDSKGPNGAFKVINSWGTAWGSSGIIWIDYNFLINEFCITSTGDQPLFIMANQGGSITPPDEDPTPLAGVDLAPWAFDDYTTYPLIQQNWINERQIDLNIYNIGTQTASPNPYWSLYYIYFNAYDANDYGVIFIDEFNTTVAQGSFDCPDDNYCVINTPLAPGDNFANAIWGWQSVLRTYYMPDITGYYYLALVADVEDRFAEQDEINNVFYTTQDPKWFQNGQSDLTGSGNQASNFEFHNELAATPDNIRKNKYQSVVTPEFRNAYTTMEITEFFKQEKANGNLDKKIIQYLKKKSNDSE